MHPHSGTSFLVTSVRSYDGSSWRLGRMDVGSPDDLRLPHPYVLTADDEPSYERAEVAKKQVHDFLWKHERNGAVRLAIWPLSLDKDVKPVEDTLQAVNVSAAGQYTLSTTFLANHGPPVEAQDAVEARRVSVPGVPSSSSSLFSSAAACVVRCGLRLPLLLPLPAVHHATLRPCATARPRAQHQRGPAGAVVDHGPQPLQIRLQLGGVQQAGFEAPPLTLGEVC